MQKMSQNEDTNLAGWLKFIPLIIFVGIAPLMVHLKVIPYPELASNLWLPSAFKTNDIFNYYKAQVTLISGVTALVGLVVHYVFKGLRWKRVYIAIAVFALLVALSAALSSHSSIAWSGYPEKMQGGLMWMTYLIFIVYTSQIITNDQDVKCILRIIQFSGVIVVAIGVFQTLGMDFFRSELGARVILGSKLYSQLSSDVVNFTFGEHQAYGTLYNPNFVGSYVSMMFPLSIFGFVKDESKLAKGLWVFLGLGSIVMLIGSQSRAGFLGIGAVLVSMVIWMLFKGRKRAKQIMLGFACLLIVGILVNSATGFAYSSRLLETFKTTQINSTIEKISIEDHTIFLTLTQGNTIQATYNVIDGEVHSDFVDENGEDYSIKLDSEGYYHLEGIDILRFAFGKVSDIQFLTFDIEGSRWDFAYQEDGVKFINPVGRLSSIVTTESGSWAGLETIGSNRGYIWSRTLPITKSTMLIGKGPDTFALEFPQTDYVNKENLYQNRAIVVDKAHSGYLGMAVELGWLAIAIFVAIQIYLIRRGFVVGHEWVFLSLGLIGIGVTNMFNDFNIHTMFLHVIVMGILIASLLNKKDKKMGA